MKIGAWLGDTRLEMKNVTRPKVTMPVFGKGHWSAAEIFSSLQLFALWCPKSAHAVSELTELIFAAGLLSGSPRRQHGKLDIVFGC